MSSSAEHTPLNYNAMSRLELTETVGEPDVLTPLDSDAAEETGPVTLADMLDSEPTEEELVIGESYIYETPDVRGLLYTEAVDQFLAEAGKHKLLTAADEVMHAKAIEAGSAARTKLESELDQLDEAEKQQLWSLIKAGDDAKEMMIISNLRLVVSIVKRYKNKGVDFADLIQEGVLGLERAVEKFDWRKGYKLSTYATWWIRQAAQRAVANNANTIRIPVHVFEQAMAVYSAESEFLKQAGRMPDSDEELAEYSGIKLEHIDAVRQAQSIQPSSLNTYLGDEKETELGDIFDSSKDTYTDRLQDTAAEAEASVINSELAEVLGQLEPRKAEIIKLRYGIGRDRPSTLEEIGLALGISRERVRSLENDALKRLAADPRLENII